MASVVCRNTFLDVISGEDEGKEQSRTMHQGQQRARSAESLRREPREEDSNEMVELQLARLNRLLCLDSAGPRPFTDGATVTKQSQHVETISLSELLQLQMKLQQALVPKIASSVRANKAPNELSHSKMLNVLSNTSLSTMCPLSEYGGDVFDDTDLEGEHGEYLSSPMPQAPYDPFAQQAPSPSMHADQMQPRAEQGLFDLSQSSGPVAAPLTFSKVPRSLDLAAEYERSSNSGSPPTTIMIRNIPNRYTQRELMQELEEVGLPDSFDFVYIPMDKCTRANLGYAFVNFIEPSWADKCMGEFQNYRFKRHRDVSSKIAAVSVAHIQGLENNLAHYANSVVNNSRHKQRRPVVLAKVSNSLALDGDNHLDTAGHKL